MLRRAGTGELPKTEKASSLDAAPPAWPGACLPAWKYLLEPAAPGGAGAGAVGRRADQSRWDRTHTHAWLMQCNASSSCCQLCLAKNVEMAIICMDAFIHAFIFDQSG